MIKRKTKLYFEKIELAVANCIIPTKITSGMNANDDNKPFLAKFYLNDEIV